MNRLSLAAPQTPRTTGPQGTSFPAGTVRSRWERSVRVLALGLLLAAFPGCTKEQQASNSCSAGPLTDGSVICIDYPATGDRAQWRMACETVMRGTWTNSPCVTANALGGCRMNGGTVWIFPSQKHRTPEEATTACNAGAEVLPPPH